MQTKSLIPHNRPCLDQKEEAAVKRVLRSKWLIAGKEVKKLEETFKRYTGKPYAVAVNSGLSALHLSLLALGVEKGDELILPTYTCVALLNAVDYVGAKPIIVDVQKRGFNLDPSLVEAKITSKTKAVIVPHTFGFPAPIVEIKRLGIPVIEDCAQAIGTTYRGQQVGKYGDISVFSFYASKMIAAGQGGMVLVKSRKHYERISDLVNHDQRQHYMVRYNCRLTDLAASVGNVQLKKLQHFLKRRKSIAKTYRKVLDQKSSIGYLPGGNDENSNHYRFLLQFIDKKSRENEQNFFRKRGISTIVPIGHYQLLHILLKFQSSDYPNAEQISQTTLSLPIYPCLSNKQVNIIAKVLTNL